MALDPLASDQSHRAISVAERVRLVGKPALASQRVLSARMRALLAKSASFLPDASRKLPEKARKGHPETRGTQERCLGTASRAFRCLPKGSAVTGGAARRVTFDESAPRSSSEHRPERQMPPSFPLCHFDYNRVLSASLGIFICGIDSSRLPGPRLATAITCLWVPGPPSTCAAVSTVLVCRGCEV